MSTCQMLFVLKPLGTHAAPAHAVLERCASTSISYSSVHTVREECASTSISYSSVHTVRDGCASTSTSYSSVHRSSMPSSRLFHQYGSRSQAIESKCLQSKWLTASLSGVHQMLQCDKVGASASCSAARWERCPRSLSSLSSHSVMAGATTQWQIVSLCVTQEVCGGGLPGLKRSSGPRVCVRPCMGCYQAGNASSCVQTLLAHSGQAGPSTVEYKKHEHHTTDSQAHPPPKTKETGHGNGQAHTRFKGSAKIIHL
eukprot:1144123-Pelagomonas_calceolata.AAC.4